MRRLLPHVERYRWAGGCDDDSEVDGFGMLLAWLGFAIEINFGRVSRDG